MGLTNRSPVVKIRQTFPPSKFCAIYGNRLKIISRYVVPAVLMPRVHNTISVLVKKLALYAYQYCN